MSLIKRDLTDRSFLGPKPGSVRPNPQTRELVISYDMIKVSNT